jgi:hypothetical protein
MASSALQKAIRRGDTDTAERAAITLYRVDRQLIWRRLIIIAIEDVGIGSTQAVIETIALASEANRRNQLDGEAAAILGACRLLADAPKDRSADYLISAALHDPELNAARDRFGCASTAHRLGSVADPSLSMAERLLAAWYSSGLDVRGERRVGTGDFVGLMRVFADMGVDSGLLEAVRIAARKTREPFVFGLPLVSLAVANAKTEIVDPKPPKAQFRNGVPLYALDGHTRLGREAMRVFRRRNRELADLLSSHVPDYRAVRASQLAVFFSDSALTSPRLAWALGGRLEVQGVAADFIGAVVDPEVGRQLIDVVCRNLDHLNAIRDELLVRAESEGRED